MLLVIRRLSTLPVRDRRAMLVHGSSSRRRRPSWARLEVRSNRIMKLRMRTFSRCRVLLLATTPKRQPYKEKEHPSSTSKGSISRWVLRLNLNDISSQVKKTSRSKNHRPQSASSPKWATTAMMARTSSLRISCHLMTTVISHLKLRKARLISMIRMATLFLRKRTMTTTLKSITRLSGVVRSNEVLDSVRTSWVMVVSRLT